MFYRLEQSKTQNPLKEELTYEKTFKDFNNGCGSVDNCRIIYNL